MSPPPRTPPRAATPPPAKRPALPPLPPPKPAAVDASLGTYAVDATLVEVPRRDVTIDGASLEFCARAGDADAVAELGRSMGTRLWPASNVLVQYLDTLSLEGERVLELGAGAGLCGLYAHRARRCQRVVLTDHDVTTLKLLRHNAALNASCGHVHALDWHSLGDVEAVLRLHGTFSTILASDVLFQARDLGAFYTCAAKLLASHGRLIVAYEDRVAGLEASDWSRFGFPAGEAAEMYPREHSCVYEEEHHRVVMYLSGPLYGGDPRTVADFASTLGAQLSADSLRGLLPAAGHLQHMPAHIYLRVGRWADGVIASEAALHADAAAAQRMASLLGESVGETVGLRVRRQRGGGPWSVRLDALPWPLLQLALSAIDNRV